MSAGHTPGPWRINPEYEEIISSADGLADICEISDWPQFRDESTANARLIAAAPCLYDALDDLLNYSGGADSALDDEYVVERARAALAKARGEVA